MMEVQFRFSREVWLILRSALPWAVVFWLYASTAISLGLAGLLILPLAALFVGSEFPIWMLVGLASFMVLAIVIQALRLHAAQTAAAGPELMIRVLVRPDYVESSSEARGWFRIIWREIERPVFVHNGVVMRVGAGRFIAIPWSSCASRDEADRLRSLIESYWTAARTERPPPLPGHQDLLAGGSASSKSTTCAQFSLTNDLAFKAWKTAAPWTNLHPKSKRSALLLFGSLLSVTAMLIVGANHPSFSLFVGVVLTVLALLFVMNSIRGRFFDVYTRFIFRGVNAQPVSATVAPAGLIVDGPHLQSLTRWSRDFTIFWTATIMAIWRGQELVLALPTTAFESLQHATQFCELAKEYIATAANVLDENRPVYEVPETDNPYQSPRI